MDELDCNSALLTMALISDADVSMRALSYRMTVLIFIVT